MKTNIKTVEQAFAYTGRDYASLEKLKEVYPEKDRAHFLADYQLKVAIEALNKESNSGNDWQAYLNGNPDEKELWVWIERNPNGVGFVVGDTDTVWTGTTSGVCSRLLLLNKEVYENLCEHFSELFHPASCE